MDQNLSLYIENARLRDYAASTARLLRPTGECGGKAAARTLAARVREIRHCTAAVRRRYQNSAQVPAACEWLLDNWYLVRREYLLASESLRTARRLRRCEEGLLVLSLCRSLLRSGLGRADEERSRLFLDGFQSITVLRRAELALFPRCLEAVCLEEIAAVCRRMPYSADLDGFAVQLEALFGTLRLFSQLDAEKLLDSADVSAAVLAADPDGVFPRMDRESRLEYLRRMEKLARREGLEEHVYARRLIRAAKAEKRHVGKYLFRPARPLFAGLYIAVNLLLTLLLSLGVGLSLDSGAAALLLLLPVSELVKRVLDTALLRLLPPRRLPRLDLSGGVPAEGRTLCVVSTLLGSERDAHDAARRLEELRFACRREGKNLRLGLLADLTEAERAETEADAAILAAAVEEIHRLNRQYGGGFYLFTRPRSFDGERWSGRERKRGALLELARLLSDRESALNVTGDRDALAGTRFLLTLDSDTRLYPGAAGELIGAMLHPLNAPRLDAEKASSPRATGSCSRGWRPSCRARIPRISRWSSPVPAAPTPTGAAAASCIWTPSAAAALPGRDSSTCVRCCCAVKSTSRRAASSPMTRRRARCCAAALSETPPFPTASRPARFPTISACTAGCVVTGRICPSSFPPSCVRSTAGGFSTVCAAASCRR